MTTQSTKSVGSSDHGEVRIEHDSMGEIEVPADALWGAQTQRAVQNFPISGRPIDRRLIRALALIKAEAAEVNARRQDVEGVTPSIGAAIVAAAQSVAAGEHDDQFPVDVFQTGSGTSSNMNANEVIARLASQRLGRDHAVHPNDHVNASQSSNDVFPSAIHLAATEATVNDLLPALERLDHSFRTKSREFKDVVKSGRTHLMDAVPITLGQEFGAYATQVEHAVERLRSALPRLSTLPIGGTAVGTGLNAPLGFGAAVVERLADTTGLELCEAHDHVAAQAAPDAFVEFSGQLRAAAVGLVKIANDLRWMASGPRTGLGEIHLPDLQPGSSIMPGKVNPVLCEVMTQVGAQVIGNDAAIAFGISQGAFELNVFLPLIARNLLESIDLLANASRVLADNCIDGIVADVERCRAHAEASPSIATSLNPFIGYERTAEIIKESLRTGVPIRSILEESGELAPDEIDRALDALALTKGGITKKH